MPVLPSNISRKQQTSDKGTTSPQSPLHLHGTSSREFPDLTDVVNYVDLYIERDIDAYRDIDI